MHTWWSHRPHMRRPSTPQAGKAEPSWNDLVRFSPSQVEWLVARGLVFLTEVAHEGRFGSIVAASFKEACRIAVHRHPGERVLGLMHPSFLKRDWNQLQLPYHAPGQR
ncbi:MAG: hypothetical protein ACTS5I_03055 [Rhodanobacter sp.]